VEVLHYISTDGAIEIKAVTAADQNKSWQRFSSRVGLENAKTYCDYASTLAGKLNLLLPDDTALQSLSEDSKTKWSEFPPVFYETSNYNFTIRFRNLQGVPMIIHKMQEVRDLFAVVDEDSENGNYIISAPLTFINEPGIFNLSFRYTQKGEATKTDIISFRIVSPKLDTKADYMHILTEINQEYNEIVYKYLTKTVQNLSRGGHSNNDIIWLSIFKEIIDNYTNAVTYIVNRPHLTATKQVLFSKADRIKRWTPKMAQKYAQSEASNRLDHDYFRHEVTINTNDTRENRFVKFTLERISKRLNSIFTRIKADNEKAAVKDKITQDELNQLDTYQSSLRKLSNSSLFRGLKGESLRSESMVLQKRTGYAQVYRYWLMLQKGIELYEGSTQIGVRPIWELYELWCFLKMREMVANILDLHFDNQDEISENPMPMIEPFTENKQEHTVFYTYGDETVRLHYQHTYNRASGEVHTATTDNRPDIVLTIQKPDGFELTYLFDAKYRVNDDSEFSKDDENEINKLKAADYPPTDAINQMHRYRDAIYYGNKVNQSTQHSAKEIIGGYILFPGRGDDVAVKERYFYRSIESVNIGAFPLLPDHNDPMGEGTLLYSHLKKVLLEQNAYEQIRDSIPQHGLVYSKSVEESNDLVLVGYYRTEQKDVILQNRLYYVPAAMEKGSINLVSGYENTKYLLLHNGDDRMLLELTGKGPRFYTRDILESFGFKPTKDFYLGFDIKSVKPIMDIDIKHFALPHGKYGSIPYFTRFKDIKRTFDRI